MRFTRQNAISEIIRDNEIYTQEKLVEKLKERGYNVTQATVSRDIREMNLVKTARSSKKACYSEAPKAGKDHSERLANILHETVQSIQAAQNIIVVKTLSGCANAAAEAIDNLGFTHILGTLAGDNTVFIVADNNEDANYIVQQINILL